MAVAALILFVVGPALALLAWVFRPPRRERDRNRCLILLLGYFGKNSLLDSVAVGLELS
jgi:hypothetical protein